MLTLGIISMVLCVLTGPFAWVKGGRVVREMDAAPGVYTNRTTAQVGRILGIISSVLMVGVVVLVVVLVAVGPKDPVASASCRQERQEVITAVSRFTAATGHAPQRTGDLVPAYLDRMPSYWAVSSRGVVLPQDRSLLPEGCLA